MTATDASEHDELEKQKALFAIELERFLNNPNIPREVKDEIVGMGELDYSSISLREMAVLLHGQEG